MGITTGAENASRWRVMLRWAFPLLGVALLAAVLMRADLAAVGSGLLAVGLSGVVAVLVIHAISFLGDSVLWLLSYESLPCNRRWTSRLYAVRLFGEAYNNATPFASMGGEPVKAQVLKDRYGVAYTASGIAFFVAKTANLLALAAFLAVGFTTMLGDRRYPQASEWVATLGLVVFFSAVVVFFVLQRGSWTARVTRFLGSRTGHAALRRALESVAVFDTQLGNFYRAHQARFALICLLAFLTWVAGIGEVWVVLYALGHPISLLDAWVVEALAQLVRTAAFFIPAGLGVMDASFVTVLGWLTGSGSAGVVVAIVRRFRDLVWLAAGVAVGVWLARRQPAASR